jgi:molybdenum cofactor cytidylyltransferase
MDINYKSLPVIVLAAGESRRMGEAKGLLDYKGKPFLSYQIEQLRELGFWEIIVVLGKEYELYQSKIAELKDIVITVNPDPERGQFSSIQFGLLALSKAFKTGVYILPLDVPCPEMEVWEKLAKGLNSNEVNATIPEFEGKKGHPVLISEEFKEYLLSCPTNSRLDYEIHRQQDMEKAKIISVKDKKITFNLNTPKEWIYYQEFVKD